MGASFPPCSNIVVAMKLTEGKVTVDLRPDCVFAVMRDGADVMVLRAEEEGERETWLAAVKLAAAGGAAAAGGKAAAEEAVDDTKYLLQAPLEVRADKQRAAHW